jgi:DNA polymerase-1
LGLDIHRLTARAAFGIIPDEKENPELFKWVRSMGKQIAFGLLYGMGVRLLSAEIGKSEEEAKKFMKNFFGRFVNAKQFIRQVSEVLTTRGYLKDKWGRRRYIDADRAFTGPNFLVQGTAADLMKDALVRVERLLRPYKSKAIITVHDEIIFDISYDEIQEVIPLIVTEMETCSKLSCVLKCDVEWSKERWSEIKSISCDECDGKGLTTDISKYELIEALFENDTEKISQAVVETCRSCDGSGYSMKKITI